MAIPNPAAVQQLRDAIKGMHFVTITTHGRDGVPRSRGLTVRVADFDGDLWFTVDVDAQLLAEVEATPKAVVLLSDRRARRYVAASGDLMVVMDPAQGTGNADALRMAWVPERGEAMQRALVRLSVNRAHYWEATSSPVVVDFAAGPRRTTEARPRAYVQVVGM